MCDQRALPLDMKAVTISDEHVRLFCLGFVQFLLNGSVKNLHEQCNPMISSYFNVSNTCTSDHATCHCASLSK